MEHKYLLQDSLLKLEKLESLGIRDTELAENEEELNKIREKFKDFDIDMVKEY